MASKTVIRPIIGVDGSRGGGGLGGGGWSEQASSHFIKLIPSNLNT